MTMNESAITRVVSEFAAGAFQAGAVSVRRSDAGVIVRAELRTDPSTVHSHEAVVSLITLCSGEMATGLRNFGYTTAEQLKKAIEEKIGADWAGKEAVFLYNELQAIHPWLPPGREMYEREFKQTIAKYLRAASKRS